MGARPGKVCGLVPAGNGLVDAGRWLRTWFAASSLHRARLRRGWRRFRSGRVSSEAAASVSRCRACVLAAFF